jgi:FtsH-binding integral membrane protein
MILSIYWQFRFLKVSNTFMYVVFGVYILAQGFGFGILFTTWNAIELIGIFAIGGGLFTAMGTYGYFAKDLSSWGRILSIYGLTIFVMWLISFLLIYLGIINAKASYSMFTIAFGILFLGYTAYDVWLLKKTSQWQEATGNLNEEMEYRLTLFFGFRLLVDLIGLIWIVVRFVIMSRN